MTAAKQLLSADASLQQIGIFVGTQPLTRPDIVMFPHHDEMISGDGDRNDRARAKTPRRRGDNPIGSLWDRGGHRLVFRAGSIFRFFAQID